VGRIVASVTIQNAGEPASRFRCDALVDTGASHMTLPEAWRERLETLATVDTVELELANQEVTRGEICGPVKIQIEGFRPIFTEVLFVPVQPADGLFEPLIGYLVLQQSQAAVDMVRHRLVHVKRLDLKAWRCSDHRRGSGRNSELRICSLENGHFAGKIPAGRPVSMPAVRTARG